MITINLSVSVDIFWAWNEQAYEIYFRNWSISVSQFGKLQPSTTKRVKQDPWHYYSETIHLKQMKFNSTPYLFIHFWIILTPNTISRHKYGGYIYRKMIRAHVNHTMNEKNSTLLLLLPHPAIELCRLEVFYRSALKAEGLFLWSAS